MRLLRAAEVMKRLGISRTTLWRLEKADPSFPRRVQVSSNIVGWNEASIEKWLKTRPPAEAENRVAGARGG